MHGKKEAAAKQPVRPIKPCANLACCIRVKHFVVESVTQLSTFFFATYPSSLTAQLPPGGILNPIQGVVITHSLLIDYYFEYFYSAFWHYCDDQGN